jgi:hypothetical protein
MSFRPIRNALRNVRAAISCPNPASDHDGSYRVSGYPVARRQPHQR